MIELSEELKEELIHLKNVLIEEREVLLDSQEGGRLEDLVREKESIAQKLEQMEFESVDIEPLKAILIDIQSLQETNEMLTRQAIYFTRELMQCIREEATKQTTYAKNGQFASAEEAGFFDHSL